MYVVKTHRSDWIMSAVSANGNTGSAIDLRATNGVFHCLAYASAVGGASGYISAIVSLQHSPDFVNWTTMSAMTLSASAATNSTVTAHYNAGAYGWVRPSAAIYSAAQTGTAVAYVHIMGGIE